MYQRYKIIVLITLLSFSTLTSCSPIKNQTFSQKRQSLSFDNLLELHNRSERAFIYHHYCLSDEVINENFIRNFTLISDLLLDETIEKKALPPQIFVQNILSKRQLINNTLSEHYASRGCNSEEGRVAKAHYDAFSQFNEKQVMRLIDE